MMIDDATLFAYLDGTLPESERQRVESQVAGDPELARRVAAQRALERAAREAFADELREPVPAVWIAAIDDAMAAPGAAEPIVIARERRGMRLSSWRAGAAIAAALVLGVTLGWTMHGMRGQLVTERAGALMASASVAGALNSSVSGVPVELSAGRVLEVELSVLGADGRFCRAAVIHDAAAAQRILACRESEGWEIAGLARAAAPGEGYRQVGGEGSLDAVIEAIGGELLDAAGEKEAIVRGWRR